MPTVHKSYLLATDGQKKSAIELHKNIGLNLRNLRKKHNMTQSDLAISIGISHQQIQKYEYGLMSLSFYIIFKLAKFFNVKINHPLEDPRSNSNKNTFIKHRINKFFSR